MLNYFHLQSALKIPTTTHSDLTKALDYSLIRFAVCVYLKRDQFNLQHASPIQYNLLKAKCPFFCYFPLTHTQNNLIGLLSKKTNNFIDKADYFLFLNNVQVLKKPYFLLFFQIKLSINEKVKLFCFLHVVFQFWFKVFISKKFQNQTPGNIFYLSNPH